MNYLLDTHTLIWFLNGDGNLSLKARKVIESSEGANFVNVARFLIAQSLNNNFIVISKDKFFDHSQIKTIW